MIAGNPISSKASLAMRTPAFKSVLPSASFGAVIIVALGFSIPNRSIASRNNLRSSAISIASRFAPIISTLNLSKTPISSSVKDVFNAVCPPIVGNKASGRSFSIILATTSGVIGSIYVASAKPGSVIIVAGLELTKITRYPSSRNALQACAPE